MVEADVDNAVDESDESDNRVVAHYSNPAPDVDRWVSIGPEQMTDAEDHGYGWDDSSGRLSTLVIDPTDPATMYAGAQSSGVWKTVDGGQSWQPISDAATLSVAGLALDPSLPSRLYLVTRSSGVYRSIDSGTSWTQISTADLLAIVHAGAFVIHPADPTRLFVASDQGVQRSTDSGGTWALSLAGGPATALVADPAAPGRLYAAIFHETDETVAGIFRTDDFGDHWGELTGCPGGGLPQSAGALVRFALDGARLYASFRGASDFRVLRTTDVGCSIGGRLESAWELGLAPRRRHLQGAVERHVGEPRRPRRRLPGRHRLLALDQLGRQLLGRRLPRRTARRRALRSPLLRRRSDIRERHLHAQRRQHLPLGEPRRRGSFQWVGHGLRNGEYYDHALAATDPDLVIGGTQDNGTLKHGPASDVWRMVLGGDGATVAVDPTDSDVIYAMNQYASSIARSTNGGGGFSNIADGLPEGTICFNLHFQVHPGRPGDAARLVQLQRRRRQSVRRPVAGPARRARPGR